MALLGDRRMDFIKSLFLVILIPFVVSSLSYASKYGENEKSMQFFADQQSTILAELKNTRNDINNLDKANDSNQTILNRVDGEVQRQGVLLNSLDREVGVLQQNISNTKLDVVKGGNERITRLEDKVFGK